MNFTYKIVGFALIISMLGCAQSKNSLETDSGSRTVDSQAELKAEIKNLVIKIKQKIEENWVRPPSTRGGMLVKLSLNFNSDGSINSVKILESSGLEKFDISAVEAVKKSSPFSDIKDISKSDFRNYFSSIDFHFRAVELQ